MVPIGSICQGQTRRWFLSTQKQQMDQIESTRLTVSRLARGKLKNIHVHQFKNFLYEYIAVGVFFSWTDVCEAWGSETAKMQAQFNDSLERNCMCISMELVIVVLGGHGQHPREDLVCMNV